MKEKNTHIIACKKMGFTGYGPSRPHQNSED